MWSLCWVGFAKPPLVFFRVAAVNNDRLYAVQGRGKSVRDTSSKKLSFGETLSWHPSEELINNIRVTIKHGKRSSREDYRTFSAVFFFFNRLQINPSESLRDGNLR
jgi:hypothetical protein